MSSVRPQILRAAACSLLLLLSLAACDSSLLAPTAQPPSPFETSLAPALTLEATPSGDADATTPGAANGTDGSAAPVTAAATNTAAGTPTFVATTTPAAAVSNVTPTPCFGSIAGQVVADLNANRQIDSVDSGVMGATLFLKNANGIVGLYTTGSGQFNFPGVMAGSYNLSETPPQGFEGEGSISADLTVSCAAQLIQNFFNFPTGATPIPTLTPTPGASGITPQFVQPTAAFRATNTPFVRPTAPPQPQADIPRGNGYGFTAFTPGSTNYVGGCGEINSSGLYLLTTSLTSQWDCIQITSDNVIFDCQGNSLNGIDNNGYGIVVHHTSALFGRPPRNVEIRRCTITRHKYGIFIDAADNLSIHDNTSSANYNDVDKRNFGIFLGLVEGGGIRVNDTRGAFVGNNHTDTQAIGIDVRNSSGIVVRGNTANANTAWGFHFYGVTSSEISYNVSSNNLRYCTWGSGVVGPGCDAGGIMMQAGSSYNVVKNNTVSGQNGNGIFIKAHGTACGDNNVIANNHIVGALYNAIELSFCSGNKIQGNEINNSLDGIWMGFAVNSEVDAGNNLHDMSNHGIISWNSQNNNVSSNRITNSREALYFYSSDYKKDEFYFVSGAPSDHVSRGNCLCANTLASNSTAAFHLANSIKNQMTGNTLLNNGTNFLLEGNTSGNIIKDNTIQGGSYNLELRPEHVANLDSIPNALVAYDAKGYIISREQMRRALWTISPDDSFDLRWFKYKMQASLGEIIAPPAAPSTHFALSDMLAIFGWRF